MNRVLSYLHFWNNFIVLKRKFSAMPLSRGALIVLEGCDRSGKSSQSKRLCENLCKTGYSCRTMSFPDRSTAIGKLINSYLKKQSNLDDHSIHLLFSANRWELKDLIISQLREGITLVVDRYSYSGIAFSAAKKDLDFEWCKQPEIGLPQPDLVLFLDIAPEKAAKRREFGNERYEDVSFQSKVYKNYLKLREPYWQIIDADRDFDTVQKELCDHAKKLIEDVGKQELKLLWMDKIHSFS